MTMKSLSECLQTMRTDPVFAIARHHGLVEAVENLSHVESEHLYLTQILNLLLTISDHFQLEYDELKSKYAIISSCLDFPFQPEPHLLACITSSPSSPTANSPSTHSATSLLVEEDLPAFKHLLDKVHQRFEQVINALKNHESSTPNVVAYYEEVIGILQVQNKILADEGEMVRRRLKTAEKELAHLKKDYEERSFMASLGDFAREEIWEVKRNSGMSGSDWNGLEEDLIMELDARDDQITAATMAPLHFTRSFSRLYNICSPLQKNAGNIAELIRFYSLRCHLSHTGLKNVTQDVLEARVRNAYEELIRAVPLGQQSLAIPLHEAIENFAKKKGIQLN